MSFLRSKVFVVLLCIALLLSVIPTVLSAMGLGDLVREAVQVVSFPFQWCATKIYDGFASFTAYFTEYDRLKAENESLREQLRDYEDMAAENDVILSENHWLRQYLSLKNEHIDYTLADAAIIGRESDSHSTVLTLNRGTLHGIATGMPVITENGVFGYVKEVSAMSCKVVSIVETASAVGAFIERSGVTGLVEGDFSLYSDGRIAMKQILLDSDIREGDLVYTSGTGSVYPRGLLIGKVLSVSGDPYSRTLTAIIQPSENFLAVGRLSHLMIVTGYEIYSEDVTLPETESSAAESTAAPIG